MKGFSALARSRGFNVDDKIIIFLLLTDSKLPRKTNFSGAFSKIHSESRA